LFESILTQVQFSATGFDQYYNPITIDLDSLEWSCDAAIGSIDENGSGGLVLLEGILVAAIEFIEDYLLSILSADLSYTE